MCFDPSVSLSIYSDLFTILLKMEECRICCYDYSIVKISIDGTVAQCGVVTSKKEGLHHHCFFGIALDPELHSEDDYSKITFKDLDFDLILKFLRLSSPCFLKVLSSSSKFFDKFIPKIFQCHYILFSSDFKNEKNSNELKKSEVVDSRGCVRFQKLKCSDLEEIKGRIIFNNKIMEIVDCELNLTRNDFLIHKNLKILKMNLGTRCFDLENLLEKIPDIEILHIDTDNWIFDWEKIFLQWSLKSQTSKLKELQLYQKISKPEMLFKFINRQRPDFKLKLMCSILDTVTVPKLFVYFKPSKENPHSQGIIIKGFYFPDIYTPTSRYDKWITNGSLYLDLRS